MSFLPINKKEMLERGWESCDFVYVIGDAYVDHPSFGHAIISRILESHGYSVGIISLNISPGNLDSSLCYFQPRVSHDVL